MNFQMKSIFCGTLLSLLVCNSISCGSLTNNSTYPFFCQNAANDEVVFQSFKSNPIYREVLEHVSYDQGKSYLAIIKKEYPDLLANPDKLRQNDKLGTPIAFEYDQIGKFSPTTLRYIKVAGDLRKEFGDLSKMHIVEIGAGYGGQCKVINDLFGFASYTIIDLPSCNALTKKYLDKLGIKNVEFQDHDKLTKNKKYDLLISNYGFSQCDRGEQQKYLEKVIDMVPKGYMTCNFISKDSMATHELIKILSAVKNNLKIQAETPNIVSSNLVFIWK